MYRIKGIEQLLTEDQVLKAASASNMDINSYLIGVGGYFVGEDVDVDKDVYNVPGLDQEVTFKQLEKGAQASNLNFDEYIAGIGAIKKKDPIKEEDMVLSGAMPSLDIPKIKEVEEEKEEPGVLESLAAQTARGFVGVGKSMLDFRNMAIFSIMEAANSQDFKTPQDKLDYYRAIQMLPSFVGGVPTASAYDIGKIEEDISEHVKQFDSSATENILKGNIGEATQQIVGGALESIPSLIMAAAGTPGLVMLATSSTGSKFDQELQQNPDKATGRLLANAIGSGVTEAAFERVTYGLLKGAKVLKSQGKEQAAKELLEAGAKQIIKNFGVGVSKEGASEAATTMSVKLIDAATLNKDLLTYDNLFEIADAGLIGGFVGGSIKGVETMSNYSEAGRDRAAAILASESDALVQRRNLERFNKRISDIAKYKQNPDKKITDTELLEQAKKETEAFERSVKQNKITNRRKLNLISQSGDLQAYASNKEQIRKSKAILSTLDQESTLFEDTKNKLTDLVAKEQVILDKSLKKLDKENFESEVEFTKELADKGIFGETELDVIPDVKMPQSFAEIELGADKFSISIDTEAIQEDIEQNNTLKNEEIFAKSDKKETSESISETYDIIAGPTKTLSGTSVKHEFLHGILRKYFGKAIESKPSEVKRLFDNTLSLVESLDAKGKISNSKFVTNRIKEYQRTYISRTNATNAKIEKALSAGSITQEQADDFKNKSKKQLDKRMLDASEEIITAISDGLTTGDLVENSSNADKIKDFFRQTYKDIGLQKDLKLDTPEQIFNFVKDYNREFKRKRLSKVTKAVAAGKVFANSEIVSDRQPLLSGLVETITKFSLKEGLSEKVQKIYENQGMNGAMEILELYRPMVLKLSNKFKDVPGFIKNKDLFVEEALLGDTGVLTMMMTYKPGTKVKGTNIDVSLAGYINKYLPLRVNAIAGKVFDRTFNQDITEEQVVNAVEATVYDGQDFSESFDQVEEKELKSKLRRKLGLTDEVLNSVRQGVINAFTSDKLPTIKAKVKGQPFKFKRELEKMFEKELRAVIQTQMGSGEQYEAFIKKNMQNIVDFIPLNAKTKSKWDIYYEPVVDPKTGKQVVYSNKQIKRLGLSELFAGTSPKAFKPRVPTEQEVLDYFINPPSVTAEGKRVMFKGNRKEALARELSRILAFDATMEVIQNPKQEVFTKATTKKTASGSILIPSKPTGETINILEALEEQNKSEIQAGAIIAEISAAIDRDPNLKFSLNTKPKRREVSVYDNGTDIISEIYIDINGKEVGFEVDLNQQKSTKFKTVDGVEIPSKVELIDNFNFSFRDDFDRLDTTGEIKGGSAKVFGAVGNTLLDILRSNVDSKDIDLIDTRGIDTEFSKPKSNTRYKFKNINSITFTASTDPSRMRLYNTLASKLANELGWKFHSSYISEDNYSYFIVAKPSNKKNESNLNKDNLSSNQFNQGKGFVNEIKRLIGKDRDVKFSLKDKDFNGLDRDRLGELLNKPLKERYLDRLNEFASNLTEELVERIEVSRVENNLDEEYIREVLINANWDTDNIKPADKKKLDEMVKLIESYQSEQNVIANTEINKITSEKFNKDLESQIENDPSEVLSSDQIGVDLDKADGHMSVSSINKMIREGELSKIFTKDGYFNEGGVKVLSKMFFDVDKDGKVVNPTAEQVFRMMIFLNSYYGGRGRLHKNKGHLNEAIIEPLLKDNKEAFGDLIKVYTTKGGTTKIQVLISSEGKPKYTDLTLKKYSDYIGRSLGEEVASDELTYEKLSDKNLKKDFDTRTELAREIFFDVIERVKKLRDDGVINDLEAKAIVYNALETSASTTSGVSIGTYINSINYVIAVEGTKDFYLEHLDPSETLRKRVLIYLSNSEGEAGYKDFEEFKSDVESMESAYVDVILKDKIDSIESLKTGYDGKGTDGLKNRFFSKEKFKNDKGNKVIIPHDLVLEILTNDPNGDYLQVVKDLRDKGDDVKDLKNDKPIDTKTPESEPTDTKPILEQRMSTIIGQKTGVTQEVDEALAKQVSKKKRKGTFSFFVPPSAEDFEGLLYKLTPKGKKGEEAMEFFKKNLFKPYAKAMYDFEVAKNKNLQNFKELKKIFKQSGINLKGIHESGWTNEQLIRVFLHSRLHPDTPIPGVAENSTVYNIAEEFVSENTSNIQKIGKVRSVMDLFNTRLNLITAKSGNVVYPPLERDWTSGSMFIDIVNFTNTTKREDVLSEWQENVDTIFSKSNMNKMTLAFGENYTNALTNMLQRMKTGRAAPGPSFKGSRMFSNWVTDASATIMFFNTKSAILQTLSTINFINWSDNNPIAAGKAFANINQYCKDVAHILNSDFLKSRRSGIKIDVNADILAREAEKSTNKIRAIANALLKMGFIPTQIGDSIAISIGGATFYRNRTNKYIKDGLSKSEAESKAFLDFKEITEATQQSSRQDRISQQQVSPLGRFVLAFANTPMQYARLTKKAYLDLVNNRGDWKTNASKIMYYGAIQNVIFSYLQQAMFAMVFDEEEEDERSEQRMIYAINNSVDGLLRGLGYGGAIASTAKNMVMEAIYQAKKDRPDFEQVAIQSTSISPPINKKLKSLLSASRVFTYKKTREKIFEEGLSFDNPGLYAASQVISTTVNVPVDRVIRKLDNIRTSKVLERIPYVSNLVEKVGFVSDQETEFWQEAFLVLGWSRWDVNAIDTEDKKSSDKEEDAIKKALQQRIYSPIVPIKK